MLAGIHDVPLDDNEARSFEFALAGPTSLHRHVANQRRYYDWIHAAAGLPAHRATFAWLEEHWPAERVRRPCSAGAMPGSPTCCGEGVRPAAVLDWEAVAIGPRELDLGWLLFFHEYFQRIAERYGFERDSRTSSTGRVVVDAYDERTGHDVRDLEWYLVYAELRQALTSIRVSSRAVHFGEIRPTRQDLILET